MNETRIDSVLLAKANFDYIKDAEKLIKYDLLPSNHVQTMIKQGRVDADYKGHDEITPLMIAEAAEKRAKEYGKDVKSYVKELEIAVKKFVDHEPAEILKQNYKRYESYDIAAEAANAEDPFATILDAQSAV